MLSHSIVLMSKATFFLVFQDWWEQPVIWFYGILLTLWWSLSKL